MMSRILCFAVLAAALAAPAVAAPPPGPPIPYRVQAEKGATYDLVCKFRAFQTVGSGGYANQYQIRGKGPRSGKIPTDNGRCVLVKTGGPGAVTLTLVKDKAYTATAQKTGEPVRLSVY